MPMLSELPGDPEKRNAVLDQSGQTAGPEQRKSLTKKERQVETTAATAAAIIGSMFSSTQNVTLGSASTFDEGGGGPKQPKKAAGPVPVDGEDPQAAEPQRDPSEPLVPWVKLK